MRKSRVAALLGISKQLLHHHARGALREAIAADGDVMIDHPACVAFLATFELTPTQLVERDAGVPALKTGRPARAPTSIEDLAQRAASAPTAAPPLTEPANVEALYALTFRQIADRYGSVDGFEGWVDLRKKTAETRRIELQNHENEGRLIPREGVRVHVFGLIEGTNRRLLQDTPKTLARVIAAAVRSGETIEHVEKLIREHLAGQLRNVKAHAAMALRARSKGTEEAA
jgi:hypothetical protein